jgi:hypothetical protein
MRKDQRVDDFINTLPDWQQAVCQQIRIIMHNADPEVEETIKRTDRPYFVLSGNISALQATKDHINLFIYDPLVPDPEKIINQGHGNMAARAIQIYRGDDINERALLNLIKLIITNNRAGGWRRLSKQ